MSHVLTNIAGAPAPSFNAGAVIGRTFVSFGRVWWAVILILLVLRFLPGFAANAGGWSMLWVRHDPPPAPLYFVASILLIALGWLASLTVVALALQPAGTLANPLTALGAAVRALPALIPFLVAQDAATFFVLSLRWSSQGSIASVGALLGLTSVLGGVWQLIFAALLAVIVPVVVAERRGPVSAARRTGALMRIGRWKIFGLYFAVRVVDGGITLASTFWLSGVARAGGRLIFFLGSAGIGFVTSLIGALLLIFLAEAWREQVRLKDGAVAGDVADVFA